jgi:hypothetical protein
MIYIHTNYQTSQMYVKWERIRRATEAYQDDENGPEEAISVVKVDSSSSGNHRRSKSYINNGNTIQETA